jgi:hypothetical protein
MAKKDIRTIQDFKQINKRTCETARQRIQLVKIVERMNRVALGEEECSKESIKAAFGLIDKLLTTKTEHETTVNIGYSITDQTLNLLRKANERLIEGSVLGKVIEHEAVETIDTVSDDNSEKVDIATVTQDEHNNTSQSQCNSTFW